MSDASEFADQIEDDIISGDVPSSQAELFDYISSVAGQYDLAVSATKREGTVAGEALIRTTG